MNSTSLRVLQIAALLLAILILLSCGGASNRMLQSISISPAVGHTQNSQVQFVATGTFSAPPFTVTPLAVNWSLPPLPQMGAPTCAGCGATITPQGLANCFVQPLNVTVTASAPRDPKLPLNAQGVPTVAGTATLICP